MEVAESRMANKQNKRLAVKAISSGQRTYTIPDHRLEKPSFSIRQIRKGGKVSYEVTGDLSAPVPPIRESKYLSKQQCIEIYRWMLLNRKMEIALENLYKQGKVVGGVYFGLARKPALALPRTFTQRRLAGPPDPQSGLDPGSRLLPRDIMMQYMAKAGSPTRGRDASSHFGDIKDRNVVSPISTLGDSFRSSPE